MSEKSEPVLMIFEGLSNGGAERHIVDVSCGLKNLCNREVIVATQGGELQTELNDNDVTHEYLPGIKYTPYHLLKVAYNINRLARKYKVRIIHSHSRYYNLACIISRSLFRTPAIRISTAHNVYPDKHWMGFWAKHTICVSNAAQDYVKAHSSADTEVIVNGIPEFPDGETQDSIRKKLALNNNDFVILNVGRLSHQKSQDLLIDAFSIVLKKTNNLNLKLLIAGDGELREQLEDKVKNLNIDNYVKLLGNRRDIGDLMKASNIFALSSRWEGLGIVLIEAASRRLPLISFKVGGIVEVVKDNITGILVEPENIDALADAILKLVTNPDICKKMGEFGRKLYLEKFTINKCVKDTNQFYNNCVVSP